MPPPSCLILVYGKWLRRGQVEFCIQCVPDRKVVGMLRMWARHPVIDITLCASQRAEVTRRSFEFSAHCTPATCIIITFNFDFFYFIVQVPAHDNYLLCRLHALFSAHVGAGARPRLYQPHQSNSQLVCTILMGKLIWKRSAVNGTVFNLMNYCKLCLVSKCLKFFKYFAQYHHGNSHVFLYYMPEQHVKRQARFLMLGIHRQKQCRQITKVFKQCKGFYLCHDRGCKYVQLEEYQTTSNFVKNLGLFV